MFDSNLVPARARLSPARYGAPPRRGLMLLIAAAHAALGWALLDAEPLRRALSAPSALTVTLLSAPEAERVAAPAQPLPMPLQTSRIPSTSLLPVPEVVVADAPPRPAVQPRPSDTEPAAPARTAPTMTTPVEALRPMLAAMPPATVAPADIPSSDIRYRVLPDITYPAVSRRLGEAGLVIVAVLVDVDGLPSEVQIVQSSGYERLDRAALDGVRRARFEPYLRQGRPSAGWVRIPIPFELER